MLHMSFLLHLTSTCEMEMTNLDKKKTIHLAMHIMLKVDTLKQNWHFSDFVRFIRQRKLTSCLQSGSCEHLKKKNYKTFQAKKSSLMSSEKICVGRRQFSARLAWLILLLFIASFKLWQVKTYHLTLDTKLNILTKMTQNCGNFSSE